MDEPFRNWLINFLANMLKRNNFPPGVSSESNLETDSRPKIKKIHNKDRSKTLNIYKKY